MSGIVELLRGADVLVCDGAMGTMLHERGIHFEHPYEYANITHPELVASLHEEYVRSGASMIETNTFGANRFKLAAFQREGLVKEINAAGVKAARKAAGRSVLVAGAIGPIGKPLMPLGRIDPEEAASAFREQAEALLESGVDLILLETFSDIEELKLAIRVVQELADIPIIAEKAFTEDGETLAEGLPARVAAELSNLGLVAIGANCAVGPQRMVEIVRMMVSSTELPVCAMPTAGLPQIIDGHVHYNATPEYFARYGRILAEAGASIIGGCCGTTPEHIRALATAVRGLSRTVRQTVEPAQPSAKPVSASSAVVEVVRPQPSRLSQKLGKKYVVAVELDIPKGSRIDKVLEGAQALRDRGCDCIDISDGARARLRMNPMAVAHLIQEQVGIEVMMHFSCRDRNLLAIQSDLLGAHALGLRNILAITGDPTQVGDYPTATSVFDIDSIGLVRILSRFNEGIDLAGNSIVEPTAFLIAVAFNPTAPDFAHEVERLRRKVGEGAQLVYTQPIYELSVLERAVAETQKLGVPMLVGILPLRSYRHAEFFHNEVPGIYIPEEIRRRMAGMSDQDARAYGMEVAKELLTQARHMTAGAYLMPPFGNYKIAEELMEAI
jgi:methionine synthase I (cobalamin-dependent)/5,10-methylenetetrahydrofolate reductase